MNNKPITVRFRRKREGKTDYKKRLKLLLSGKPRFVVRPSLKGIVAQISKAESAGDKIVIGVHSDALKKLGWKHSTGNIPSAYLTGFIAGKKAMEKGIKEAILDIGLKKPVKGGRIFACLKGASDAGLKIPFSDSILPSPERIKGEHISEEISKSFNEIKNKINKE